VSLEPAAEAFTELLVEVFRVNGLLLQAGDRLTRPVGLSSARWQVLGVVEHGPSTVAHVARTMGRTRQSVQQTADALARDGLVEFIDNPQHRRAKLMVMTADGRAALAHTARAQARWANAIAADASVDDIDGATRVLRDIARRLEERE
jgi:DNA-binding MarR family transcriptional regulator